MEQGWSDQKVGWKDRIRRLFDARSERRDRRPGETAVLSLLDRDYRVRVLDRSSSGAMLAFDGDAREGDAVTLQMLDQGPVAGQVRWSRGGRIGVTFTAPPSKA